MNCCNKITVIFIIVICFMLLLAHREQRVSVNEPFGSGKKKVTFTDPEVTQTRQIVLPAAPRVNRRAN